MTYWPYLSPLEWSLEVWTDGIFGTFSMIFFFRCLLLETELANYNRDSLSSIEPITTVSRNEAQEKET